jgi:beta-glucosidase
MPWREDVPAILWAWLPGQEGGAAIADALLGVVEPGGRLPTSFPAAAADAPVLSTTPVAGKVDYSEGSLFGYRAYEHAGTCPAYPFGHGLGYTRWRYQDITAAVTGTGDVNVQVRVRNVGDRAGREIVQIYLGCEADVTGRGDPGDPPRLVGFDEVLAAPGEIGTATVVIPRRVLARWDAERRRWWTAGGTRKLIAAHSALDRRLTTAVELSGGPA